MRPAPPFFPTRRSAGTYYHVVAKMSQRSMVSVQQKHYFSWRVAEGVCRVIRRTAVYDRHRQGQNNSWDYLKSSVQHVL